MKRKNPSDNTIDFATLGIEGKIAYLLVFWSSLFQWVGCIGTILTAMIIAFVGLTFMESSYEGKDFWTIATDFWAIVSESIVYDILIFSIVSFFAGVVLYIFIKILLRIDERRNKEKEE